MRSKKTEGRNSHSIVIAALSSIFLSFGFLGAANSAALQPVDVSAALSTIEFIPPDGVEATGQDEVRIVINVLDGSGQPVVGAEVAISSTVPEDVIAQPIAPTRWTGKAVATIASEVSGPRVISATVQYGNDTTVLDALPTLVFQEPPPRPNVVLIVIDDTGTDFLSMYDEINPYRTDLPYVHGGTGTGDVPANGPGTSNLYIHSPTLQSLTDEGVIFMNAYAMPVCSPTRACLLTGEYPVRHGVGHVLRFDHDGGTLDEFGDPGFDFPTLTELVQGAGYDDAIFGKWHLGAPRLDMHSTEGKDHHLGWASISERGHFTEWSCVFNGLNTVPHPPSGLGTYYDWVFNRNYTTQAEVEADPASFQADYATTVQVQEALAWCNSRTSPFFCMLSPNAAHGPWGLLPPEELVDTGEYKSYPLNAFSGHCATIEAFDSMLGQFLYGLDPAKRDLTTFIVVGDNGTPDTCLEHARIDGDIGNPYGPEGENLGFPGDLQGSAKDLGETYNFLLDGEPSRFKHGLYEKGIRIPMIVSGYGVVNGGRTSHALIDVVDVFPTVAELLGEPVPPDQHGISFLPVLNDEVDYFTHARDYSYSEVFSPTGNTGPGTVFTERKVSCSMIIPGSGRYKIIRDTLAGSEDEFYRLQDEVGEWDDPFETEPIPHDPGDAAFDEYLLVKAKMEAVMASGDDTGPHCCETAENFCTSLPNSTGEAATISFDGSCSVVMNDLTLFAEPVPVGFGIFYYCATQVNGGSGVPYGNGMRCAGDSPTYRLRIVYTRSGRMVRDLDIENPPKPGGQIEVGTTWHFQAWFRDPNAGGAQSNLSDGLSVTFGL
jgi:arylsulfatase A-like enzyme